MRYKSGMFDNNPEGLDMEARMQNMEDRIDKIISKMEVFDQILQAHDKSISEIKQILKENDYLRDSQEEELE